jgi:hypothetical protein
MQGKGEEEQLIPLHFCQSDDSLPSHDESLSSDNNHNNHNIHESDQMIKDKEQINECDLMIEDNNNNKGMIEQISFQHIGSIADEPMGSIAPMKITGLLFETDTISFREPLHIDCEFVKGHGTSKCDRVYVIPNTRRTERGKLLFSHSNLFIYCNTKVSHLFMYDDVCKIFSSREISPYTMITYTKGHLKEIWEVCLLSLEDTKQIPKEKLEEFINCFYKPHTLILILDCPESIYLWIPSY